MKRFGILTLIFVFAFAASAFALDKNIKAGNMVFGGAGEFDLAAGSQTITPDQGDDITSSTLGFGLEAWMGYFVIDGLELGPLVGFGYDKLTQDEMGATADDDLVSTTTSYDIGLQIGYFFDVHDIVVPYGMLRAAYGGATTTVDNGVDESDNTFSGFVVGPKAGIDLFFYKTVALDLGLFFDYRSGTNTFNTGVSGADDVEVDMVNTDYGLAVGFNVFF